MGAQGTTTLNFGAHPGSVEAQVDVTGQAGLTSASLIEAWVFPVTTADHSSDEHLIENLRVMAVFKVNGEFTIRGFAKEIAAWKDANYPYGKRSAGAGPAGNSSTEGLPRSDRLWGLWTIGWVWN